MNEQPRVTLSGFGDEAAHQKTAVQQFAAFAALGLQYYSLRFIDAGEGIKNVMKLSIGEIQTIRHLEDEYGLNVASIGSPIGKVKLLDVEDGTQNAYVPFKKYLEKEVKPACEIAHAFETKLIRGFSFYHPKGTDPREHLPQVVDQLGQISETCLRSDLTYGVELEANLVGQTGDILADIHRQVNNPALVLIFDGGNLACQGFSAGEILDQFRMMLPGLGWLHIKDYRHPQPARRQNHVDEEALKHFVPADRGRQRPRSHSEGPAPAAARARSVAAPPRHSRRVSGSRAARQGRRAIRRVQRARRHGRGTAIAMPGARLRPHRISPARLRRHLRGARFLADQRLVALSTLLPGRFAAAGACHVVAEHGILRAAGRPELL